VLYCDHKSVCDQLEKRFFFTVVAPFLLLRKMGTNLWQSMQQHNRQNQYQFKINAYGINHLLFNNNLKHDRQEE
jgi:hypothetical protein